jgi:hypothetical protein
MSDPGDPRRRRLEGVIPDLLKRAVEKGVEKATEAPDSLKHLVGDMKLPKEVVALLLSQVDDTKNGLFRVVAKEMRDFLEQTNLTGELQSLLTTVQFEINTTIRFSPNDQTAKDGAPGGAEEGRETPLPFGKPEVETEVFVHREERSRPRE